MPFDGRSYPTIASLMLAGFGPKGERWCGKTLATPNGKACLVGRFLDVACGIPADQMVGTCNTYQAVRCHPAFKLLKQAAGSDSTPGVFAIALRNDAAWARRDFSEIRRILELMHALEIAAMVEAKS